MPHWLLIGFAKEISIAMLGAVVAYGGEKTREAAKNRRDRHRFPVAGDYLTEYEDETPEGVKTYFAPASLQQTGLHVKGTTQFGDRRWVIEGSIHREGGYLSGVYHADNPYDKGVGNFFLAIRPDGRLEGLWSGYDSESGTIHAGRYLFRKKLPVAVLAIDKRTVGQALAIAEHQLGDSYIQEADFLDSRHISLCALHAGTAAGFCMGKVLDKKDFASQYPKIAEALTRRLTYADTVGIVTSMATAPAFERQGVAHALLAGCLAKLDALSPSLICTLGWKSARGVHIDGLVRKFSFQPVHEFVEYWKEDSLAKRYRCPVCGDPPCRCNAVVYIRHTPVADSGGKPVQAKGGPAETRHADAAAT